MLTVREAVSRPPIGCPGPLGKFCVDIFSNNNNKYDFTEYQLVKIRHFMVGLCPSGCHVKDNRVRNKNAPDTANMQMNPRRQKIEVVLLW